MSREGAAHRYCSQGREALQAPAPLWPRPTGSTDHRRQPTGERATAQAAIRAQLRCQMDAARGISGGAALAVRGGHSRPSPRSQPEKKHREAARHHSEWGRSSHVSEHPATGPTANVAGHCNTSSIFGGVLCLPGHAANARERDGETDECGAELGKTTPGLYLAGTLAQAVRSAAVVSKAALHKDTARACGEVRGPLRAQQTASA